MSDMPERVRRCTTHHHACDCREYEFEQAKARIEALKAAIGNINTQKEIVMKYAKESDRLMAVGRMYQAIADAAALLQEPTND